MTDDDDILVALPTLFSIEIDTLPKRQTSGADGKVNAHIMATATACFMCLEDFFTGFRFVYSVFK